ncbi:DUF975 family protein [Streptococcus ovuberis]|uniref:DUF975 family protein n=1 Tax=Streptococcus ovuberis TaxID=1936207 RepID=A0A7X6MY84_9STRE|nr:DUF975 family protein [Streptococcus ovuberis]NKZ20091.1 DUF975 family protein [Streptococcus ovuberis]
MENYDIRAEARRLLAHLKGKYTLFSLPILIFIFQFITRLAQEIRNLNETGLTAQEATRLLGGSIFLLTLAILGSFIQVSVSWTILNSYRNQSTKVSFKDSLLAFKETLFSKAFAVLFIKGLFLFLWTIPSYLMFVVMIEILTQLMIVNGVTSLLPFLIVTMLLGILCFLPVITKSFSYAMAHFTLWDQLASNTYSGATNAITESRNLMKGYKKKLFWLEFSFIGWWILVGVTFGLAAIYVIPYITTARAIFYQKLKENSTQNVTETDGVPFSNPF